MKTIFLSCVALVPLFLVAGMGILVMTTPRPVPPSSTAPLHMNILAMQSMVREAAIFGWRCHERGSEDECAAAVLRIVGGGT